MTTSKIDHDKGVIYTLSATCPAHIIYQSLETDDYDYSMYESIEEAWVAEKSEWWVKEHDGGVEKAREQFMETLHEATPEQALQAAWEGYGWPTRLGYVEESEYIEE